MLLTTTYEVAALNFVEPEKPEVEEDDNQDDEADSAEENVPAEENFEPDVVDMGDAMSVVANMEDNADYVAEPVTKEEEEVAIVLNPEQLNLF